MAKVNPLIGTLVVFIAIPLIATQISSVVGYLLHLALGVDPVGVAVIGSLPLMLLGWFLFVQWNISD